MSKDVIDRALESLVAMVKQGGDYENAYASVSTAYQLSDDQAGDLAAAYEAYSL